MSRNDISVTSDTWRSDVWEVLCVAIAGVILYGASTGQWGWMLAGFMLWCAEAFLVSPKIIFKAQDDGTEKG